MKGVKKSDILEICSEGVLHGCLLYCIKNPLLRFGYYSDGLEDTLLNQGQTPASGPRDLASQMLAVPDANSDT